MLYYPPISFWIFQVVISLEQVCLDFVFHPSHMNWPLQLMKLLYLLEKLYVAEFLCPVPRPLTAF